VERARITGGIKTITGRWIPADELDDHNPKIRSKAERRVISCTIQGSAADIIKLAMIESAKRNMLPSLTVHDELIYEVEPEHLIAKTLTVKEIMENVVKLDVPLTVEVGTGSNWGEAKA
jgi:DNA polymerase-1